MTGKSLRLCYRGTIFNHEIDVRDAARVEIYLSLRRMLGDTCGYERFIERTGGQILYIQQRLGWCAQDSVSAAIEMSIQSGWFTRVSKGMQPFHQEGREGLKTWFAVLGPCGVQAQSAPLAVQMFSRQVT